MSRDEVENPGERMESADRSPVFKIIQKNRDGSDGYLDLPPGRRSVIRIPSEECSDFSEEKDERRPRREKKGSEKDSDRGRGRWKEGKSKGSLGTVDELDSREERHRGRRKMESDDSSSEEDSEKEEVVVEGGKQKGRSKGEKNGGNYTSDNVSEEDEDTKRRKSKKREKRGRKHDLSDEESEDDGAAVGTPTRKRSKRREKSRKHSSRGASRRKHRRDRDSSSDDDVSESDKPSSSSDISETDMSDTEDEAQKEKERKRRRKRRKKEKEREKEREKEKEIRRTEKRKMKEKKLKSERKKKKREMRAKQPITTSWGKYGILKDIDMWNKRPEFSAWLAEVKKVNMEVLSNWEEKQMFKEYMEDYNTATFPSKKYYNLDIYHRRKVVKARVKGLAKFVKVERTDFNDEEQRRLELRKERDLKKEEDVEALMRTMQSGMAQAMRDQAQLREEMQYQFRLGNVEAAQAIQRRLDPDADKLAKM